MKATSGRDGAPSFLTRAARLSVRAGLAVALLASVPATGAVAQEAPAEPPQTAGTVVETVPETQVDRDVRRIASKLRCVVCQGLSLQDSPSELAQQMRGIIRSQLEEGKSEEEIKAYFVSKYGEWVLMEPTREGFNLAVYVLPVLMLLGGAGFVLLKARQWAEPEAAGAAPEVLETAEPAGRDLP